jgi:hypothetical protein
LTFENPLFFRLIFYRLIKIKNKEQMEKKMTAVEIPEIPEPIIDI